MLDEQKGMSMEPSKTVLIVDDNPDAVEIASLVLSELEGVSTVSANEGNSGLTKAREIGPDLIILDVQMPGKDGFTVFAELQKDEATREIPVVMLTGVANETGLRFSADDMDELFGAEPAAYLEKPVAGEALLKTVKDVLGL